MSDLMINAQDATFPDNGIITRIKDIETSIASVKDELNNQQQPEWRVKESNKILADYMAEKTKLVANLSENLGFDYNVELGQAKADLEQIKYVIKVSDDEHMRVVCMISEDEAAKLKEHYEALEIKAEQEVERLSK